MAAIESSSAPSLKIEHDAMAAGASEPHIKPDPDSLTTTPAAYPDDDIYEDAGDLDFSQCDPNVWLMRVPKYLWENWASVADDEEITLGRIRVEKLVDRAQEKSKFTMILSPSVESHRGLPREYNIDMTNEESNNTYIFTEKDLPGFKSKGRGATRTGPAGGVVKGSQQTAGSKPMERERSGGQPKWEKGKRGQTYYKRAIPKQTALSGVVKHELSCVPANASEESRYLEAKAKASSKPRETVFLGGAGAAPGNLLNPGTLGSGGSFSTFIKTAKDPKKPKQQDMKNARIPQNELFDLIYECFSRYNYWPFKSLKAELNQPDQYLKETLEVIAEQVRTGRFALTWTLKAANKVAQYGDMKDEMAPIAQDTGEGGTPYGDDEGAGNTPAADDDEEAMEDVVPG